MADDPPRTRPRGCGTALPPQPGLVDRRKGPVVCRPRQQSIHGKWHADGPGICIWSRLDQKNAYTLLLAQPGREDTSGGATTNNDEVEIRSHSTALMQQP